MNCSKQITIWLMVVIAFLSVYFLHTERYFPLWAKFSKNNVPIQVLDTNSSLGRYSNYTKKIALEDLAKIHGHLCDGLVISFVELNAVFKKLFQNGIVDRTDLRVVSKNGPCWIDASSMLTGARLNFGTLSIDKSVGNGFIVQKISTGETYQVKLKEGVFPEDLAKLETEIKLKAKDGKNVRDEDIKQLETFANNLSERVLNSNPKDIIEIKKLENYNFKQNIEVGSRTDIINKKDAI